MIPKIIHYIWLGNNPIPPDIQECIDSWKKYMPDYQLMIWNNETIKNIDITFVTEALSVKKWAFASDVIRLWAIYNYGGIYLDTDVKVCRSFDDLLSNKAIIGREGCLQIQGKSTQYHLTSFCFGAEKGSAYIAKCMSYYNGRHFIMSSDESLPVELRLDVRNASQIHSEIATLFGYNPSALAATSQKCGDALTVYPPSYFASVGNPHEAYCHHLSIGSWREKPLDNINYNLSYKIKWRVKRVVERIMRYFNYVLVKLQ